MKKWIAALALTLAAALSFGAMTSCGGDPCEELAELCAKCPDESTKSGCRAAANADEHDACETGLQTTYRMQCGG